MTVKTWTKLSNIISEIAGQHLKKDKLEAFMKSFNEKKTELNKLMNKAQTKKVVDRNAPSKPKSSYIIFCGEHRKTIQEKHPDMKATQITTELGKMWKALSDKKKEKYVKQAEKDKERYQQEMENYTPPPELEESGGKKKRKDSGKPKKANSAYIFFCKTEREKIKEDQPDLKGKDVAVELGKRWKELSDEEKQPFQEEAEKDKERYDREKEEMNQPFKKTAKKDDKKTAKKDDKKTAKKDDKKTAKKDDKKTAKKDDKKDDKKDTKKDTKKAGKKGDPLFDYFSEQIKGEIEEEKGELTEKQLATEINKRWKALSEEDRDSYKLQMNTENASDEEEEPEDVSDDE